MDVDGRNLCGGSGIWGVTARAPPSLLTTSILHHLPSPLFNASIRAIRQNAAPGGAIFRRVPIARGSHLL